MAKPKGLPRPGGRSARVRADVLAAVAETVAAVGYDGLSIDEVARRAGVHKTSIYRRWPSKADLVIEAMHDRSDHAMTMPDTGHLASDVLAFLRDVAAYVISQSGRALLVASLRGGDDPDGDETRRRFWSERLERAVPRLEQARARGELPAETDTTLLLEALISPIHFRALVSGLPIDARFLESIIELHGLQRQGRPRSG